MQINNDIPLREKNIVLIGFMGVGKTTIGRHLSDKLYRDFIDIDQEIEKLHGMPVSKIFESMGEKAFRQMEKEFIIKLCTTTRLKIISLGGGSFLQEEIKQVCLANSIVFYLDLSWDSWKDRLQLIIDSRPVLQNKTLEEIEKLFYSRQAIYETNHSKVSTDSLDPEEIADHIIDTLKLGWELYS
ncbi:shikimate kinase [Paenibacillus durus]|uniref:shikimate kinase n=1 Tax=Paenibacillus durus TaxID=44251 RepID=UPI000470DFA5|nr:shikimate kinase [Paenibacillus durus]